MKILIQSIFVALLALSPFHLIAHNYSIQDLGTLAADESYPVEINNQNSILGFTKHDRVKTNFIWKMNEALIYLPDQCQHPFLFINNHNEIAGVFWHKTKNWFFNNITSKHFYLYQKEGFFIDLGRPKDWKTQELVDWQTPPSLWDKKDIEILAFTDDQQMLIANSSEDHKSKLVAIWDNGTFQEIDSNTLSDAYGMNNQSLILGRKWVKNGSMNVPMLVLYNSKDGSCIEIMKDINILRRKLNDLGQVIIFQVKESTANGFLWDPNKGLMDLEDFAPIAFNNCNQIVGFQLSELQNKKVVPLLWTSGEVFSLNQLIGLNNSESLWSEVNSLNGINDNGYIIGQGVFDGKKHAFVLVPSY